MAKWRHVTTCDEEHALRCRVAGDDLDHLPPRQLAKWLLCIDVARGYSIHDLVCSRQGAGFFDHRYVEVQGHKVIVSRPGNPKWETLATFKLEHIVDEIKRDLEAQATQPALW